MKSVIQFIERATCPSDRIIYLRDDLTLSCAVNLSQDDAAKNLSEAIDQTLGIKSPDCFYLIADTLTIVFHGHDLKCLIGFDAYTNILKWKSAIINVPSAIDVGVVALSDSVFDSDRINIDATPEYEFDECSRVLRIRLRDACVPYYGKISDHIIVGLDRGNICELIVCNLEMG